MPSTVAKHADPSEITILARVLSNGNDKLPPLMARYLVGLGFSDEDRIRMHDLAVRNQDGALTAAERDELFAYAKAGTVLSILISKARRTLGVKPRKRTSAE